MTVRSASRFSAARCAGMTPRGFVGNHISCSSEVTCEHSDAQGGAENDAAASSIEPLQAAWPDLPESARRQILALASRHVRRWSWTEDIFDVRISLVACRRRLWSDSTRFSWPGGEHALLTSDASLHRNGLSAESLRGASSYRCRDLRRLTSAVSPRCARWSQSGWNVASHRLTGSWLVATPRRRATRDSWR